MSAKKLTSLKSDAAAGPVGTREEILQGALQVFLEHGYDNVNMEMVAGAAKVARRTLYNQFPEGKEFLFRSATEHFWSAFPVFEWTGKENGEPRAGLTEAGVAIADFWRREEAVAYLRLAIAEVHRFPDLMRSAGPKGMLPMMKQLMQYLSVQAKRKRLAIPSPELAMRQFFGLICEPLLWPRVVGLEIPGSAEYQKKVVDSAVTMFLKMYDPSGEGAPRAAAVAPK